MSTFETLTWDEIEHAAIVGVKRNIEAFRNGVKSRQVRKDDPLGFLTNIEGAIAECAVAKWAKVPWDGQFIFVAALGEIKRRTGYAPPDVGKLQVRTTTRFDGRLILRPRDNPNDLYIHTRLKLPRVELVGCILARDGMKEEYAQDFGYGEPAFFVPNDVLKGLPNA